ncbi:hypothetical protein PBY51_020318 [Eleginops maclovinus]|uniref:Uncharacterized protein n=1 Tax=Eleginops maclovinus TaxID=56733 RepID=A0AAN7XTD5_ELEMC|nr:hypothetical protein PBY51_020318 [Eleginops maclovinus]
MASVLHKGIIHFSLLQESQISSTTVYSNDIRQQQAVKGETNHRGAFASGAASPGSPCRKTAASGREEKRNKPRKTEGRRKQTGAQRGGRELTVEEDTAPLVKPS